MQVLLVFALLVSGILACSSVDIMDHNVETSTGLRKRRSVEEITVTLVTNKKYDKKTTENHRQNVRKILDDFQEKEGFFIDYSEIQERIKDEGGKFAIEYRTEEECEQVKKFVQGAKSMSREIAYALLNCGSEPLQIL